MSHRASSSPASTDDQHERQAGPLPVDTLRAWKRLSELYTDTQLLDTFDEQVRFGCRCLLGSNGMRVRGHDVLASLLVLERARKAGACGFRMKVGIEQRSVVCDHP